MGLLAKQTYGLRLGCHCRPNTTLVDLSVDVIAVFCNLNCIRRLIGKFSINSEHVFVCQFHLCSRTTYFVKCFQPLALVFSISSSFTSI